jgi:enoyl-CoA hydratase/carnithine racemase
MSAVQLTVRPDSVAIVTLDQSGRKANVLTAALWDEFEAVLDSLAARPEIKGMVLASGKPDIFIAGADLNLLGSTPGPGDPAVLAFIEQGLRVLKKLESLPFPTCAAIDGAALGGGLEVALACDYRLCGTNPQAKLGLPEVKLGLIPGWGGTQRLPRVAGLPNASAVITTGRSLDAPEAAWMKMIDSADATSSGVALVELAAGWIAKPAVSGPLLKQRERKLRPIAADKRAEFSPAAGLTAAAEAAVRVMVEGAALPLYDGIKLETEAFMRLAGSDESKRLIVAFFTSRKK